MKTLQQAFVATTALLVVMIGIARCEQPAGEPTAEVDRRTVEEVLLNATKDSFSTRTRNWIRHRFVHDCDLACYHLCVDEPWQKIAGDKPLVIVVHGYNSSPCRNQAMVAAIREAGYPCGTFAYPNDYTIS